MNIPKILQTIRERSDLSQSDMATVFDLSQQTYSNIETGRTKRLTSRLLAQIQDLAYGNKSLQTIFVENGGSSTDKIYKKLSETHTNVGGNDLHINKLLRNENKYEKTLANTDAETIPLKAVKKIRLLTDDNQINLATFTDLLPSINDRKAWIPSYKSASELIRLNYDNSDPKTVFPMYSDEIIRNPYVAKDAISVKSPPYDNMLPKIYPDQWIYVIEVEFENYHTGIPYLIGFSDFKPMIYYISKGSKEGYVRLTSEDKSYGEKEELISRIIKIYEVLPR